MGRGGDRMPEEDYEQVMGGKLKLKGSLLQSVGIDKKKKKKKKDKKQIKSDPNQGREAHDFESTAGAEAPVEQEGYDALTPSERRAFEHTLKLESKKIEASIKLSHRERIDKLNQSLGKMAEHYDIPRVGPG